MSEWTDAAEVHVTEDDLADFLADALEPYEMQDCARIAAANADGGREGVGRSARKDDPR